jgi:hypothetical protein
MAVLTAEDARERTRPRLDLAEWLTLEKVAYGLIALLGIGLRVLMLDRWPLGPAEAAQALPAWAAATGQAFDLTGTSPLLFSLQRLAFTPLGPKDALARWWPALFGGLAVLLFYALRDRLSRGGALMAALLWATSPMAVFTSRLGLGYGLVPTLALAVLAGVAWAFPRQDSTGALHERGAELTGRPKGLLLSAVALGLLLASGPGAYTVLLIGIAAGLIWRSSASIFWREVKARRRDLLLAGGLALALGATFGFTTPAGLAAVADLLGTWLRNLRPGAGEYTVGAILGRLVLTEPLVVGFALAGLVISIRGRDRFGMFAGLAAGLALLVSVIGNGRYPADLGLLVMAGCLLAGPVVARVLRGVWTWARPHGPDRTASADPWLLLCLSLVLLASAAICLPGAFNPSNTAGWRQLYSGVGVATTILAVLLWLIYGVWGNWRTVRQGLPALLLAVGMVWAVGQLTSINYDRGAGRRAAVLNEMPSASRIDFEKTLKEVSALLGGGATEAPVDVLITTPAGDPLVPTLRWALRGFPSARIVASLPPDPAPIVITPPEEQPALAQRYSGSEYTLLERWTPSNLGDFYARLRWILYREVVTPPEARNVVLWVARPELGPGQPGTIGTLVDPGARAGEPGDVSAR